MLLLAATLSSYFSGLLLPVIRKNLLKKLTVTVCLVINLGLLLYFKYKEFFDGHHVWVFEDGELMYLSEGEAFLHYADLGYGEYVVNGSHRFFRAAVCACEIE